MSLKAPAKVMVSEHNSEPAAGTRREIVCMQGIFANVYLRPLKAVIVCMGWYGPEGVWVMMALSFKAISVF